jgi:SAM-dependent methyltransferase
MPRSAFTRDIAAIDHLIAREQALIQAQIAQEPAGVGVWLSPWDAPILSSNAQTSTFSLRLAGSDAIDGKVQACASLWPFADNALAFVALQHALDYAMEPEELLAEAVRCMRGHGKLIVTGFRGFSAARLARGWKRSNPNWATASSWARACKALGLADIVIESIAVGWPWLSAGDSKTASLLGRALPNLASVFVLSARKRGVRARPVLRASRSQARGTPVFEVAGFRGYERKDFESCFPNVAPKHLRACAASKNKNIESNHD